MMSDETASAEAWAREEFGDADLGDKRRTRRLVAMAKRAALAPSGKVSEVFQDDAERQGAYDLIENKHVEVGALLAAMGGAVARRSQDQPFVFVPLDGSSLNLADRAASKDFGVIGSPLGVKGTMARGLKVISAIGVDPQGIPLGIAAMTYWTRQAVQQKPAKARKLQDKETRYWLATIDQAIEHLGSVADQTRLWFQLDREADAQQILEHLSKCGHLYTVRGNWNRKVRDHRGERRYVYDVLARQAPKGTYRLRIPEGPGRSARHARMSVRAVPVTIDLHDKWTKSSRALKTNVVWVREEGHLPAGQQRLEWLLVTNHSIETLEDTHLVLYGYTQRWRIEEFHRTWKQGSCNVEAMQLHSADRAQIWATILAAVSMRIERLKYLSRNQPDLPATEELSRYEIEALVMLKRQHKKKNEEVPDGIPTIAQATRWIADLGGYTGKSSGGPPGAVTIGRGLEYLMPAAALLKALDQAGKLR
jgi:hypothetical protein